MAENQEWLNQNAYRKYPFQEDTILVPDNDDTVDLPNKLFVDIVLTTAGDSLVQAYLDRVAFVGNFLTCVFTDQNGATIFTSAVNTGAHTIYDAYPITGQGDYEDARGVVVFGDLSQLSTELPDGNYLFTDARVEPCVVRPDIRGVRSLRVGTDDTISDYIRGHVKLIEGTNVRMTFLPDDNAIRIDAISGEGLNQECDCGDGYERPECIRTINGVNAEDVQIVGDGRCVEVQTDGNAITITDKCSQPCCGCAELEFITTRLDLAESVLRKIEEYSSQLDGKVDNTIRNLISVLGSGGGGG